MGLTGFLFAYVLGGVTFIPLVIVAVLVHAHCTFPYRLDILHTPLKTKPVQASPQNGTSSDSLDDNIVQPGDDLSGLRASKHKRKSSGVVPEKEQLLSQHNKPRTSHEPDSAAGYFAVCRDYTPMGINAKPIERSTPVGSTTVAAPSQSVYQAMYRSIFDRNKAPGPLDDKNNASQRPKRAGNVFYVMLRHGHLMLFDDEEMLEVRHVISLAHHDVSVYSGGDTTPEGELWIKRSALCLSRKKDSTSTPPDGQLSKPFFLFSENSSAKEDFYFALLRNQDLMFGGDAKAPIPRGFRVKDILTLVQRLHSTEEHLHTRWLNAMIGRVFLAIHRTADFENFIREKLTTKISRVKKPGFLTDIAIRGINTGDSAPWITNPKLQNLNVEGECVVEADVRYTGSFRIEVATTARIDLGARFKVREVDLVLAVVLRKIEGRMLFKVKPAPSNRIWQTFQTMPKIELAIEPIVSTRQITYTVILRQIENRIKEVIAETLVFPFWDDTPFFRTEHKRWRGGIFEDDDAVVGELGPETIIVDRLSDDNKTSEEPQAGSGGLKNSEKSHSVPNIEAPQSGGMFGRKNDKNAMSRLNGNGSSTNLETVPDPIAIPPPKSPRPTHTAESAVPLVVMTNSSDGSINGSGTFPEAFKPLPAPSSKNQSSLWPAFTNQQSHSGDSSPLAAPSRPPMAHTSSHSSSSSQNGHDAETDAETLQMPIRRRDTTSSAESVTETGAPNSIPTSPPASKPASIRSQTSSIGRNLFTRRETSNPGSSHSHDAETPNNSIGKRANTLAAVTSAAAQATAQARQWGWNAIQRHKEHQEAKKAADSNSSLQLDLSQPMGGGRPLPPPGMPLPGPEKPATKIGPSASTGSRRPSIPSRPTNEPETSARPPPTQSTIPDLNLETQQDATPLKRAPTDTAPEPNSTRVASFRSQDASSTRVPTRRRVRSSRASAHQSQASEENLFVVAAPEESEPTTPTSESLPFNEDTHQTSQETVGNDPQWGAGAGTRAEAEAEAEAGARAEAAAEHASRAATPPSPPASVDEIGEQDIPKDTIPILASPSIPALAANEEDDDDGYANWMDEN